MNREKLLRQIEEWNEHDQHQRVIEAIEALPREEWDYELTCLLARAYNNTAEPGGTELEKAASLLKSVEEDGRDDPLWHYRMGYAYFFFKQRKRGSSVLPPCSGA